MTSFCWSRVSFPLDRLSWLSEVNPSVTFTPFRNPSWRSGETDDDVMLVSAGGPSPIPLHRGALPTPKRGPKREQRERTPAERPARADVPDGPLGLLGLGRDEGVAHALQTSRPGERVGQRERDAVWQVRPRRDGRDPELRDPPRRIAFLHQEIVEAPEPEHVAQVGVEGVEVVRAPSKSNRNVSFVPPQRRGR